MANRIEWMDNLRGMSVLAVMLMHATTIMQSGFGSGVLEGYLETLNHFLAPFRIGMMFFVSGFFVESGLRHGRRLFINNKFKSIVYPYFVWSIPFVAAGILKYMIGMGGYHSILNVVVANLTGGELIIWFLFNLFLYFLMILVARNYSIFLVIPVCYLLAVASPVVPADSIFNSFDNTRIGKFFYLFAFFYMGDWVIKNGIQLDRISLDKRWLAVSVLALAVATYLNFSVLPQQLPEGSAWQRNAWMLPIVLLTIPAFVAFAIPTCNKVTAFVGTHSIIFYLVHYWPVTIFKETAAFTPLRALPVDLLIVIGFALSMIIPWLMARNRERFGINYLFTLKQSRRRAGLAASA